MSLKDAIKKEAKIKDIEVDENIFDIKEDDNTKNLKDENSKIPENNVEPEKNKQSEDRKDDDIIDDEDIINEDLKKLGKDSDDLINAIIEIGDSGTFKESGKILNGKIKYTFEIEDVFYSKEYVRFFAEKKFEMQSEVDYYLALFSLASVLKEYNGSELPSGLLKRADVIEEKIKGIVYKILLEKADEFHSFTDILTSPKVETFLQEESIS